MKNTINLKIDNSNIMSSHEKAYLKVTSPSGKTLFLMKHKLSKASKLQRAIFWKFCKDPFVRFVGELPALKSEMKVMLSFSKL